MVAAAHVSALLLLRPTSPRVPFGPFWAAA